MGMEERLCLNMTVRFVSLCGTTLLCALSNSVWTRVPAVAAFVLLAISSLHLAVKTDRARAGSATA